MKAGKKAMAMDAEELAALAEAELARRELAMRRLMPFATYMVPWYHPYRHHELIAGYLEQVELYVRTEGQEGIGRLMILLQPRSGKTEEVSRLFPAWVLGRNPDKRMMLLSYGADLAVASSRAVRSYVLDDAYANLFGKMGVYANPDEAEVSGVAGPVGLSEDSRSAEAWDLAKPHRGGVKAAGVGGAITGSGAHILIADDLFKNREEAESKSNRERVWEWWTSSAYTRLEKGAAIVISMTRWHPEDLVGRLLRNMAESALADQYVVVCLPALAEEGINLTPRLEEPIGPFPFREGVNTAPPTSLSIGFDRLSQRIGGNKDSLLPPADDEKDAAFREMWLDGLRNGVWINREDPLGRAPGEALWPEKYPVAALMRIRANSEYDFVGLYQQQPYAREGGLFKREYFPIVERVEGKIVGRVRYWDKAASEGKGDYTSGVLMAKTEDGYYYVEHVVRGQWSSHERDMAMKKTWAADCQRGGMLPVYWHEQEGGSGGVDSALETNKLLIGMGVEGHAERVTGSKESRVASPGLFQPACEAGLVRLVRGGWNEAFIEECIAFPRGRYDDQVDGGGGAFRKLAKGVKREAKSYTG